MRRRAAAGAAALLPLLLLSVSCPPVSALRALGRAPRRRRRRSPQRVAVPVLSPPVDPRRPPARPSDRRVGGGAGRSRRRAGPLPGVAGRGAAGRELDEADDRAPGPRRRRRATRPDRPGPSRTRSSIVGTTVRARRSGSGPVSGSRSGACWPGCCSARRTMPPRPSRSRSPGSVGAFVEAMNARARALGMSRTTIRVPARPRRPRGLVGGRRAVAAPSGARARGLPATGREQVRGGPLGSGAAAADPEPQRHALALSGCIGRQDRLDGRGGLVPPRDRPPRRSRAGRRRPGWSATRSSPTPPRS